MVFPKSSLLFCLQCLLLSSIFILLVNYQVKCDEYAEEDILYQAINRYRASLKLKPLIKNEIAECLADEIADQFKLQPCTNTTGANAVPGTEPQFFHYPEILSECNVALADTRDGTILPACVPGLVPSLVITNFTRTLYSDSLNDTKYTGIGIGSEDNWIVVVLTSDTLAGNFVPYSSSGTRYSSSGANLISITALIYCTMLLLVGVIFLF